MSGTESKRRRLDGDYNYVATSTTARTAAKAAANNRAAAAEAAALARTQGPSKNSEGGHIPLLTLASLPPAALQRYLSRYGLLDTTGTLSYHHAVFPVPPLPSKLTPPLNGRSLIPRRPKASHSSLSKGFDTDDMLMKGDDNGADPNSLLSGRGRRRMWQEPKATEFADLSAYDSPQTVINRLAARATTHWEKKDSIKEGETLTNFMFALRMRDHTLRATPQG